MTEQPQSHAASARDSVFSPGRCEVRKLGYSVHPWRIVEASTGREVWAEHGFDHPNLGPITIPTPLSFDRKRDALAALVALEAARA